MIVIPAIDIINGQCVRLTQGNYNLGKVYSNNPVEVAQRFEAAGATHLHLVDLDGAKAQHIVNHRVLYNITQNTGMKVDFGGGVKTDEDIRLAFESGATQITAGSIAAKSPETVLNWISTYGAERIILGADTLNGHIAVNGWQQTTTLTLLNFVGQYVAAGISYVICTDVSKDGMLQGPAFDLYRSLLQQYPGLKLIASGGVAQLSDVEQLRTDGLYGTIVGKAIYEGNIGLSELFKNV